METEKLYSPLEFYLHDRRAEEANGEYGYVELYDERYKISHYDAAEYMDAIELAIRRDRDRMDQARGMAEYVPASLDDLIISVFPNIEIHGGKLWCAANITSSRSITPGEMGELAGWWSEQLSDGWGESLEQHEIKVGREELYVVPWSSDGSFFLETEREFMKRIGVEILDTPTQDAVHEPDLRDGKSVSALKEAKLYSPVFCNMQKRNKDGSYAGFPVEISQWDATQYFDNIHVAITTEPEPEEAERGLMTYYDKTDSINKKVRSLFIDVEVHDSKLWAVAILDLVEPLTPEELGMLRDYIKEQYADGWGEKFQYRNINVDNDDLHVCLWKHGDEFFIDTQEQFSQRLGKTLPPDTLSRETAVNIAYTDNTLPDPTGRGYVFAIADNSDFYIPDALHVERDDNMMTFNYDEDAADAAKRDGIPLISDMDGVPDDVYIDTPENREIISLYIEDEPVRRLRDRLKENYEVFKRDTMDQSKEGIFYSAAEILPVMEAYGYFSQEHSYIESDVAFLLKFENPLELITDRWNAASAPVAHTRIVDNIFNDQERTLQKGGYTLMPDEPVPALKPPPIKTFGNDEKLSVLAQIRRHQQDMRERPAVPKDTPDRKKSGPEL